MNYQANYDGILMFYPALLEFSRLKLPVKKAWLIWKMLSEMKIRFDFYCVEEMKLATKYAVCSDGKPIVTKGGKINFSSEAKQREYEREIKQLKSGDAGEFAIVEICFSEIGDQYISPETILLIKPVVVINENGGDNL